MESDTPEFTTLIEALQYRVQCYGDGPKTAFIFRDKYGGRRVLSWQRVYDLGGRFAAELRSGSIGRGDFVLNTLLNSPERVVIETGILMSGAASVNAHCHLADGSDFLHTLRTSRVQGIVLDPDIYNSPWTVLQKYVTVDEDGDAKSEEFSHLKKVYFVRRNPENIDALGPNTPSTQMSGRRSDALSTQFSGARSGAKWMDVDFITHLEKMTEFYVADVKPDDAVSVFTTSGSTGFSKLVLQKHGTWSKINKIKKSESDYLIDFNISPMGWAGGYLGTVFANGSTRVTCDVRSGNPDDVVDFTLKALQEEGCVMTIVSPAVILKLADRIGSQGQRENKKDENEAVSKENQADFSLREPEHKESSKENLVDVGLKEPVHKAESKENQALSRQAQPENQKTDSQTPPSQTQLEDQKSDQTFKKLELVVIGGMPVSRNVVKEAYKIGKSVLIVYGGTDSGLVSMLMNPDPETYTDFDTGVPRPTVDVKIVGDDDENTPLPKGKVGNVLVKLGSAYPMEYFNDPEATAAAFTADGYFRIGDVGCLDDRGHLIVQGRGSDAIMRGPYIFYPGWLEARIRACPGVSDVVVVGVPDPLVNEELCACLVLTSDDVTVEEVRQFVEKDILAPEDDPLSPRPRHYLRFETFPMTVTDKPRRKIIKELAAAKLKKSSTVSA